MKLHGSVGNTPLDAFPDLVGAPLDRVDGPAKVTGTARYSYEVPVNAPTYGYVVPAGIASGRIAEIDAATARQAPGVLLVMTHHEAPQQGAGEHRKAAPQMTGPEIRSFGQPIAVVVAETFEQARAAAHMVRVRYEPGAVQADLNAGASHAGTPQASSPEQTPDSAVGEFAQAFAAAPVQVDSLYSTPPQSHAAMEPHATIAFWNGPKLTVHNANQMVSQSQAVIAHTLQMPKEDVQLISTFVGGGFGAKLWVAPDCILAAMASRAVGRPVKLALTRRQVFHATTHRSATVQRVRLGADREGRLLAVGHDSLSGNREGEPSFEGAAFQTRTLYAGANRLTRHRQATLTLPVASSMRAPGEAVGMLALEQAMDELAERLGIDPIELRERNEPSADPERHVPYSSRHLVACMREGAKRFGWEQRKPPGGREDGRWLLGLGMAAATRANPLKESKARVRLGADGVVVIETAMTDIGTGTYTILAQVAASMLGVPAGQVQVKLGDSAFPDAAGSGGSFGAGSSGSAVYDACMSLRGTLADAAGFDREAARFKDGRITAANGSRSVAELVPADGLVAEGDIQPGDNRKEWSQQSYGAHFTEVAVDRDTGEIRVRRMLGVFTVGRVLNAKTARSQAIGGMIFGIGAALEEALGVDLRMGLFANNSLAEYHVPVHADVPDIDAVFLPELDDKSNPLKSKGIGELGICGAGAAIANAVYNATGVRVRNYPVTLDKVLAGMEQRA